jgi:hypothetical protein
MNLMFMWIETPDKKISCKGSIVRSYASVSTKLPCGADLLTLAFPSKP